MKLRKKDEFCRKKLSDAIYESNESVLQTRQGQTLQRTMKRASSQQELLPPTNGPSMVDVSTIPIFADSDMIRVVRLNSELESLKT